MKGVLLESLSEIQKQAQGGWSDKSYTVEQATEPVSLLKHFDLETPTDHCFIQVHSVEDYLHCCPAGEFSVRFLIVNNLPLLLCLYYCREFSSFLYAVVWWLAECSLFCETSIYL